MNDQETSRLKTQKARTLLDQFAARGMKFEAAKERLLSLGFSEADINLVMDDYDYGGAKQKTSESSRDSYYASHPQQAAQLGADLLKTQRMKDNGGPAKGSWYSIGYRPIWIPASVSSSYLWLLVIVSLGILILVFKFLLK